MMRGRALWIVAAAVALLLGYATPAVSDSNNNNSQKLRNAVTVEGIVEHLEAFQSFADADTGNRLSGTSGYESTVEYVAARAEAAGLDVTVQEFDYELGFLADWQAPILDVVGGPSLVPGIAGASPGGDFGSMFKFSPYGVDTTAPVWAVDLTLDDPTTTTSGCEVSDFDGVPEGAILVMQRGNCSLLGKILNAQASGAAAMAFISAVPGDDGTVWFGFDGIDIPTVAITLEAATELVGGVADGDMGREVRFRIDWRPGTYTTQNVIAETSGRDDNVVVVGAHLDSVGVGAGINDNGSGSAAILEIAEQMTKVKPRNQVRFHLVRSRRVGPSGIRGVRQRSERGRDRQHRGHVQLRHDRLRELRPVRVRR